MTKITCISDLHGFLPKIEPTDILIIAGDVVPLTNHDPFYQANWLNIVFKMWLKGLPAKHIVLTWGNHDIVAERHPDLLSPLYADMMGYSFHVLHCSAVELEGLKIWGSPFSLPYGKSWAFMFEDEYLKAVYDQIPRNVNILINHGAPKGYGDLTTRGEHTGSQSLTDAIYRIEPELVLNGHIHEAYGIYQYGPTRIVNCSMLDHHVTSKELTNKPWVFVWDEVFGNFYHWIISQTDNFRGKTKEN